MKTGIFVAVCGLFINLSGYSQSLSNTTWNIFDHSNSQKYIIHYENDTVFVSTDFVTFEPFSRYAVKANTVSLTDLPGVEFACPADMPGTYTFNITSDSLYFSLLSDRCIVRQTILTDYFWVRSKGQIEPEISDPSIMIFPNPSCNGIFNLRINNVNSSFDRYYVSDIQGRILNESVISGSGMIEQTLDLSEFPSGTYLLNLIGKNTNSTFKLLR